MVKTSRIGCWRDDSGVRRTGLRSLSTAAVGIVAFLASTSAFAASDDIPASISAVFDGTYEIVFYDDSNGGISYTYYDTVTHVGWNHGSLNVSSTNCPEWPQCTGPLVGSPMTSWYNSNGTGVHVAFLMNNGNISSDAPELFLMEGEPTNGFGLNGYGYGGDDASNNGWLPSGIPSSGVVQRTINGHNALFASSPTSLANFSHGSDNYTVYTGTDGRLHSQYDSGGGWGDYTFGGARPYETFNGANLTAMWDGSIDHVFYYGFNTSYAFGLYELYYNGNWWQGSPPQMQQGWLSSSVGSGITEFVFGAASSGMQLDYDIGSGWADQSVVGTGCGGTSPTATYRTSNSIYSFCSASGSIWMAINGGSSGVFDMSLPVAAEQGNSYPAYSPVAGFQDGGGTCHLYYIGTDSALHELYSSTCAASASWSSSMITSAGAVAN